MWDLYFFSCKNGRDHLLRNIPLKFIRFIFTSRLGSRIFWQGFDGRVFSWFRFIFMTLRNWMDQLLIFWGHIFFLSHLRLNTHFRSCLIRVRKRLSSFCLKTWNWSFSISLVLLWLKNVWIKIVYFINLLKFISQ